MHLYGRRAGVIARDGGRLTFDYDPAYVEDDAATPLSLSMPLATVPYRNRLVEAHLRGLLPDNADVRSRWAAHFGVRDRNTFGLVAAIGSDAAGGAVFLPEPAGAALRAGGRLEPIDDAAIAQRLRRLREDSSDWLGDDEHWSLAGAQSKFTLRETADGWAVPHGLEPSSHIVKPGISHIPGQALTEHVCMVTAAALGLEVASTRYCEFEDQPAIVVTRFDRRPQSPGGTELIRVHQEDMCQAFGLDPIRKYEADGGPGAERIAALMRRVADDDSVERFARAVVVNYVLGAPDAHAKNYSVLLVGPVVRLAPLYDVASGLASDRGGTLRYPRGAMSIGGAREFGRVSGRNWDAFADRVGVDREAVRGWVEQASLEAPGRLAEAIDSVPGSAAHRRVLTDLLLPRVGELARMTLAGIRGPESLSATRRVRRTPGQDLAAAVGGTETAAG